MNLMYKWVDVKNRWNRCWMAFLLKLLPRLLNYYLNKELNGLEEPRMSGTCRGTSVSSRVSYFRIISQGRPTSFASQPLSLASAVWCNYYPTTAAPFMHERPSPAPCLPYKRLFSLPVLFFQFDIWLLAYPHVSVQQFSFIITKKALYVILKMLLMGVYLIFSRKEASFLSCQISIKRRAFVLKEVYLAWFEILTNAKDRGMAFFDYLKICYFPFLFLR